EGRTVDLGKVMAAMLDGCNIPFAIISGDTASRSSNPMYPDEPTQEGMLGVYEQMGEHLAPLWGTDRLLVAIGNHDGAYGSETDASGTTRYYTEHFPAELMWDVFFRPQALDFRRVFSEDGQYFYVDNVPQKTRCIVLNSHYGQVSGVSCYGQDQLEWLANVALDMPEGYGAVITAHIPPKPVNGGTTPATVDCQQLNGIIDAYRNKTTFSGSYTASDTTLSWIDSTIDVDFTSAKGEIIAMFAGHIHWDTIDTTTLACPLITIMAAGAPVNEVNLAEGEAAPTRTFGTDTETSFDVVTINRATRTIYCTRVGAGEDRVVSY
ncbi:MAG: metallophosphoesterase, partial [Oscillospiraceae bacterium]|nr:metallophosphoesterase [Oscillospiraceae bacterium]